MLVSADEATLAKSVWSSPESAVQLISIGLEEVAAGIFPKLIEVTTDSAEEGDARWTKFRVASPSPCPEFVTTILTIWSPGASFVSPEYSTEPPDDSVNTDTEKSGVDRPLVASTVSAGIAICKRKTVRITVAMLRLDIRHSPPECVDLYRFTLPSPCC